MEATTYVLNEDNGVLEPIICLDESSSSFSSRSTPSPGVQGCKRPAGPGHSKGVQSILKTTENMLDKNAKERETFWGNELKKQRDWEELHQVKLIESQEKVMNTFMDCMSKMSQPPPVPNYQYPVPVGVQYP